MQFEGAVSEDTWNATDYDVGSFMQFHCAQEILKESSFLSKNKILDLGCGNGKTTAYLSKLFPDAEILGIDRSVSMIRSAVEHYSSNKIAFKTEDVSEINDDQTYDLITSFFCLDWVIDQRNLQRRVANALVPGGEVLFVISTGKDDVANVVNKVITDEKWTSLLGTYEVPAGLHSSDEYQNRMREFGLVIDECVVKKIPVTLSSIEDFRRFISALPLLPEHLDQETQKIIMDNVVERYQEHCEEIFGGRIICEGEMIIIRAHKT